MEGGARQGPTLGIEARVEVADIETIGLHPEGSTPTVVFSGALTGPVPAAVGERTFEALVFDWDGTAVPDRQADAKEMRARVEALCAAGVHVFVVSGTHVGNVDRQLGARPIGAGVLHLCLNRGSEVFEVGVSGPVLSWRRTATDDEDRALDEAARLTVEHLGALGLDARIVSQRLNRRKIDLIPEPEWGEPPKARIAELLSAVTERLERAGVANLAEVVAVAHDAARAAGIAAPRITSDVKHVEIGLTDKADSARWAAAWLAERGIGAGLVLVAGDEFGPIGGVPGSDSLMLVPEITGAPAISVGVEPEGTPGRVLHLGGGPGRLREIVDLQLARRGERRVPSIDFDPEWILPLPTEPANERVAEAIGTLANGWAATRASLEEDGPTSTPLFAVNGLYTDGPAPTLLAGPRWCDVQIDGAGCSGRRLLDLRTGVLAREEGSMRSLRFVSLARPAALALRVEGPTDAVRPGAVIEAPSKDQQCERARRGDVELSSTRNAAGGGITVAAGERHTVRHGIRMVERLAAWRASGSLAPGWDETLEQLREIEDVGFDRLLAEHREAWARRWADATVSIAGDPDDQLAARFALFHLLSAAPDQGEAAVGARGLTGPAYGGHVFWDADVFVLPALAATRPPSARAMLEYRLRRLPAARRAARVRGQAGARFPWESAHDGGDVTPRSVPGVHGESIPIRTGDYEEHIVADVAWAACEYAAWSGNDAFLTGPGRDLLLDSARYWQSRARRHDNGTAHLLGVMGPDEYHEIVDDNAFTNIMARWNLRRAAAILEDTDDDPREAAGWRALADALVDGWDSERRLHEQFAGYWELEPLLATQVAKRPVAADVLLGAKRVAGSQLIKQADVIMAHHLVPGELAPESLSADLAFYEPRTAHGSSLSPAIYATQWARAGQPDRALELFRMAARLDLDDLTGTTAGGLHLATFGGVWQALAYGFLGLRPRRDALTVAPCLPAAWEALDMRLRFHGAPVRIHAEHGAFHVACLQPLLVRLADGSTWHCEPPGRTFAPTEGSSR